MPGIKKLLVAVDANTIIHFGRAGLAIEPGAVLEGVLDPFVFGEIERNAPDLCQTFLNGDQMGSWLRVVRRDELELTKKRIYDSSFIYNRLMFDPQDWGEARAIALGHALGAVALLTDDTKKSGPRDYIIKEAIESIDTIAFWEVLLMLFLVKQVNSKELFGLFEQVRGKGYQNPPNLEFKKIMVESVQRLRGKRWFQEWLRANGVADFDARVGVI